MVLQLFLLQEGEVYFSASGIYVEKKLLVALGIKKDHILD